MATTMMHLAISSPLFVQAKSPIQDRLFVSPLIPSSAFFLFAPARDRLIFFV